ncbi:MAG: amino acid permease [Spirochaetales bacterium]|nr:amino acid permease [Spirochaetales bacterium]
MELKKQLSTLDVFSIASGAMISSGLFVLPAIAFNMAGTQIIISYFLAGLLMLPAVFSQLELTTAIPRAGGAYFFVERILGTVAGTVAGFANWFSISLKSAFALIGIGAFAALLFPGADQWVVKIIASGACVVFTCLNLIGAKSSSRLQTIMVISLLVILVLFILLGYRTMDFTRFSGILPLDWDKIFLVTGMVFISYGGLTKISSISEEIKNPGKTIVKSEFAAFIIVEIIYVAVIFVLIGVLPAGVLNSSLTPVSTAGNYLGLPPVAATVAVSVTALAALLAFITTANAGILSASRIPMSMSRDGLLMSGFAAVSKKRKAPYASILGTSVFMLAIILLLNIEDLAKVASLFMILLFLLVNISLIVIRQSKIANYKPTFHSPFYPVTQIAGIIVYSILIIKMGLLTLSIAGGFIVLSFIWYFVYSRKKVARKSAFVHMIEQITAKELIRKDIELENELLEILLERNDIIEDRFDSIIRQAAVLDFKKTVTRDELFSQVGDIIGKKWGIPPVEVVRKLTKREKDTSTLIYPGVAVPHAIPHIIIEGEHSFDIVLIRNKFGIIWNEEGEVVYTAFCLLGTMDERNFHLRALMAIAQILQDPHFHKEWTQARNEKELRSVILLTKRKREKKTRKS